MKKLLFICLSIFVLPLQTLMADETPKVVVSIKPLHSLVSAVMEGVATPTLLVKKGSPHAYSLRPSEARALANADLVVWIGHEMESFLEKPLETVADNAMQLELAEVLESSLLKTRDGAEWDEHEHHDEHGDVHEGHDKDHEGHEEHAVHDDHDEDHEGHEEHAAHDDHDEDHEGHEEHAAHDDHEGHEDHADHEEHHHGVNDMHLWLDPKMAQRVVIETAKALIAIDPAHAAQYQENATKLEEKLVLLDQQLVQKLAPVKTVPYLAFHSAYQYFEVAYDLNAVGSVTIDPDRKPGAKGISEIRERVKRTGARAVFSEPQFESSLVETIIEGSGAKTGVLDPLGSDIEQGPEAYFILLNNLANNLVTSLK
ncbi:zinc ABC transporter substrate-binding protein [Psychromonas sp. 14N.309.X.WAT.B.A12]|uniref:zinc ABC transporter substrate-binding protein n=1 Tax=Psychromonas sp. 14N.309.X.WAT.B.A12 TaxID=2998322 RepID=UPI0025B075FC|nr:zinc ABC transporter substrate-binding protein [Psychromonas sp. 14N.309.X.WAT.B.A12]MDN2664848.1 zinc ABC transporter substrate-binding protein [Psychromonas sp. 14N.309.X.WAT.B.A12]